MIIEGQLNVQVVRKNDLGITKSTEGSYGLGKDLVAKALVHTHGKVLLRIIYLSDDTETLYTGTHVTNVSSCQTFTIQNDKIDIKTDNAPEVKLHRDGKLTSQEIVIQDDKERVQIWSVL